MSILFIHTFLFPSVMMKSLILSLLLPGVLLPAAAQTTAPDTLVQVDEARRVVLTATDSLAELTIEAAGATPLTFIITVWTVPRLRQPDPPAGRPLELQPAAAP